MSDRPPLAPWQAVRFHGTDVEMSAHGPPGWRIKRGGIIGGPRAAVAPRGRFEAIAFHEAGHAVIAILHGYPLEYVELRVDAEGYPAGGTGTWSWTASAVAAGQRPDPERVELELLFTCGGPVASEIYGAHYAQEAIDAECTEALFLAKHHPMAAEPGGQLLIRDSAKYSAYVVLVKHWHAVRALAREVLKYRRVSGLRACQIVKRAIHSPLRLAEYLHPVTRERTGAYALRP